MFYFDARMRQNRKNFRELREYTLSTEKIIRVLGHVMDDKYSTRLADGSVISGHDDWECLRDFAAHGYIVSRDFLSKKLFEITNFEPGYRLNFSDAGFELASKLRRHCGLGGNFKNFKASQ